MVTTNLIVFREKQDIFDANRCKLLNSRAIPLGVNNFKTFHCKTSNVAVYLCQTFKTITLCSNLINTLDF